MDLNKDKESFIDYLKYQKHYSLNTIENYERTLTEFIEFLNKESIDEFSKVKYPLMRGYLTIFK